MRENREHEIGDGEASGLSTANPAVTQKRRQGMKAGEVVDYLLRVSRNSWPTFAGAAFEVRPMDLTWSDSSGLRATLRLSDAVRRKVTPAHLNLLITKAGMLLRDAGRIRR